MKHAATETMTIIDPASMQELTENTIYLMGLSFVLGSLFTIFVLILLDFMKRDRIAKQAD